jgi:hypothetical protein
MCHVCRKIKSIGTIEAQLDYLATVKNPGACVDVLLGKLLGCRLTEPDVELDQQWEQERPR